MDIVENFKTMLEKCLTLLEVGLVIVLIRKIAIIFLLNLTKEYNQMVHETRFNYLYCFSFFCANGSPFESIFVLAGTLS